MEIIAGLLQTSILAGGVLALAALGEVLAERVGVVNLGVEGLMALGAIAGIATVIATRSAALGFICALGIGLAVGMIFASATVILRANQVLCGLALTLMGTGLAATIGKTYSGMPAPATFAPVAIPYLSEIPLIGHAVFTQNIL
ncbi:ABC transporter permease subunit, partial [Bradyrhizobium sp.]